MTPDDANAWQAGAGRESRRLIERYQEVAHLSRGMLAAANRKDWDEVARLEAKCRAQIDELKRAAMIEPLSAFEQRRRIELLREILRDDAQMRVRAEPWLLELERLIGMPRHGPPSD